MHLVRDIYNAKSKAGSPVISFEFFPPKTPEGEVALLEKTIPALFKTRPDFCSVTYGAGGSTRDKTLRIVERIEREHGFTAVAHLTCVSATQQQIGELLGQIRAMGVRNVLALRGDPPNGGEFLVTPGGFEYSSQLVRFISAQGDFCIGVAGFPEGHIACKEGKHVDWAHLKGKIDAGADYVITQLFFDNADYFSFREHMQETHGVNKPLVPGIIPIASVAQIKRFTAMSGARIPMHLAAKLEELGDNVSAVAEFGIE